MEAIKLLIIKTLTGACLLKLKWKIIPFTINQSYGHSNNKIKHYELFWHFGLKNIRLKRVKFLNKQDLKTSRLQQRRFEWEQTKNILNFPYLN